LASGTGVGVGGKGVDVGGKGVGVGTTGVTTGSLPPIFMQASSRIDNRIAAPARIRFCVLLVIAQDSSLQKS
jgi:hypothetical protein